MFRFTAVVIATTLLAIPAYAAEVWHCTYEFESPTSVNHVPRAKVGTRYQVDKDEVRILGGNARYRIVVNTDFGLSATRGDLLNLRTGGPAMLTEVISLNRVSGAYRTTQVHVFKDRSSAVSHEGNCQKE